MGCAARNATGGVYLRLLRLLQRVKYVLDEVFHAVFLTFTPGQVPLLVRL